MERGTQLACSEGIPAVSEPTLLPRWKFKQCGRELTMTDKHICSVKMYVLFEYFIQGGSNMTGTVYTCLHV